MIRSWPSMTTTVSSERVMGLKYGYSPAAWTSRARVKFLHLSNSAICCRVAVRTKPRFAMSKRWYSLARPSRNRKAHCETCHSLSGSPRVTLNCGIRAGLGRSSRRFIVAPCVVRFLGVTALLCSFVARTSAAQDQRHPRWEIPGFDFRKDGVWRTKARAVRAMRARLRAAGRFAELNASATAARGGVKLSQTGQASATAVTGTLNVPAILIRFKDSPTPTFTPADYNDVLFGAIPTGAAAGRPYTYRSFYQELSNGLFDIQGQTFPYVTLDSNEVYYTGGTSSQCQSKNPYGSTNCNGIWSPTAQLRMQSALREAIQKIDPTVDFSAYVDPATGFVPLVLFMHQAIGGECGPQSAPQNHLWAHRYALAPDTTQDNDPFHPGEKVTISDYILQPSVGGSSACNASQIMPIGTVAHETGHSFGLPDLYDNPGPSEGIGQWGLMSSGNFTSPFSPSRMEAWSLDELGWITLAPLTTNGTYSFDAAPLSDTAFYVNVPGVNPRGEYFLIENRQRQQSDTAVIRSHCVKWGSPASCS